MKKKAVTLNFRISLAIFVTFVKTKIAFMRRDIAEFLKFGVDEDKLTAFEQLVEDYANIPTDEELLGEQMIATEKKDLEREKSRKNIAEMMTRVENKFGLNSGTYRKFGIWGVSTLDGGELSYSVKRVIRVAKGLLPDLASEGLTTAILEQMDADKKNFDDALATQEDAIAKRDIATEDRGEQANEIYQQLVKHCDTGKRIWENKNEAKYNDYIIYDTPSGQDDETDSATDTTTKQ